MFDQVRVLFLCINFHGRDSTVRFVRSVDKQTIRPHVKVLVIDNSVGEDDANYLASNLGDSATVLRPGKNLGFFGAAAWGYRQVAGAAELPPWVIVSNADIEIAQCDFCERLDQMWIGDHEVHIVAPAIISKRTGLDENPRMRVRPTRARMRFYYFLYRSYYAYFLYQCFSLLKKRLMSVAGGRVTRSDKVPRLQHGEPIYAPHGAFIAFHRSYFDNGGALDYGSFLFGEEIFVAELARRRGMTVRYDPSLCVVHDSHSTTGVIKNRTMLAYERASIEYLVRTFFS